MTDFLPGRQGRVVLRSEDILHAAGQAVNIALSKQEVVKATFGASHESANPGQKKLTFTASGVLTPEKAMFLNDLYENEVFVDFTLQMGKASSATDGGTYNGKCLILGLAFDSSVPNAWAWALDARSTGPYFYTPAAA